MEKIYLVGSLRNEAIPIVGNRIRALGYEVFDQWHAGGPEADDYWQKYSNIRGQTYKEALNDYAAKHIFEFDKHHLDSSDMAVMVMPAGKSGHLELGYMAGRGKKTYILFDEEPTRYDVMNLFATDIFFNVEELLNELRRISGQS